MSRRCPGSTEVISGFLGPAQYEVDFRWRVLSVDKKEELES